MHTAMEDAARVVHLLCEGVGVRACERLTGINRNTVLRILETVGAKCARLLDHKVQWVQAEQVQVDELWAYVFCKQKNNRTGDAEHGDQYTWLGIDRKTKLIIAWHVAKRDRTEAGYFMRDLRKRIATRCQLSTDGFSGYSGHLGAVFQTFRHDVDYASVTKLFASPPSEGPSRYSPAKCIGVKKEPQIGCPRIDMVCTSHVERQNLNMRLFNRRMTRLTLGYSKKVRNLRYAVAIQIAFHNFCRVHSAHKQTPAVAAGLTDHTWTIEELLKA